MLLNTDHRLLGLHEVYSPMKISAQMKEPENKVNLGAVAQATSSIKVGNPTDATLTISTFTYQQQQNKNKKEKRRQGKWQTYQVYTIFTSIVFPSSSFSSTQCPLASRILLFLGLCKRQQSCCAVLFQCLYVLLPETRQHKNKYPLQTRILSLLFSVDVKHHVYLLSGHGWVDVNAKMDEGSVEECPNNYGIFSEKKRITQAHRSPK